MVTNQNAPFKENHLGTSVLLQTSKREDIVFHFAQKWLVQSILLAKVLVVGSQYDRMCLQDTLEVQVAGAVVAVEAKVAKVY